MDVDFQRTRETAAEAASTAKLLTRAQHRAMGADKSRLTALAARYSAYAEALLDTISGAGPGPAEDQEPLL